MIKQAYIKGFMRKCAEYGVDSRKLIAYARYMSKRAEEPRSASGVSDNGKTRIMQEIASQGAPKIDISKLPATREAISKAQPEKTTRQRILDAAAKRAKGIRIKTRPIRRAIEKKVSGKSDNKSKK